MLQARGAIANFMGHIEVQPEESNYRLTPGLWLVGALSASTAQMPNVSTLSLATGLCIITPDISIQVTVSCTWPCNAL